MKLAIIAVFLAIPFLSCSHKPNVSRETIRDTVYVQNPIPKAHPSKPALRPSPAARPLHNVLRQEINFTPGYKRLTTSQKATLFTAFRGRDVIITGTADSKPWRGVSSAHSVVLNRNLAQARANVCAYAVLQAGAVSVKVKWISPAHTRSCRLEAR